jgi:hypothetical protein
MKFSISEKRGEIQFTKDGKHLINKNFGELLEEQRQIYSHCIMFGNLELEEGRNFSSQLLSDVESLLIACEQPWGNDKCKKSRISRGSLKVKCLGNWIGKSKVYLDI